MPAFCVGLGGLAAAALFAGDDTQGAIGALVIMAGLALLLVLGGRWDLVRGLRGDGRDEYWARIDVHATALAGHVVIGAIVAMCVWEWAHGRDGTPYAQLGALGGLAYLGSVALLRWRS
jgi:hypothetical protein